MPCSKTTIPQDTMNQQIALWLDSETLPPHVHVEKPSGFSSTARISVDLSTPPISNKSESKPTPDYFDPDEPNVCGDRKCSVCDRSIVRDQTYRVGNDVQCMDCVVKRINQTVPISALNDPLETYRKSITEHIDPDEPLEIDNKNCRICGRSIKRGWTYTYANGIICTDCANNPDANVIPF